MYIVYNVFRRIAFFFSFVVHDVCVVHLLEVGCIFFICTKCIANSIAPFEIYSTRILRLSKMRL